MGGRGAVTEPGAAEPYDAVLLASFGGPEGPDDVLPFLRRVTAGRNVPEQRLHEVAEHYLRFGGVSPINEQNRKLLAALRDELSPRRVYWGNRNGRPFFADAFAEMRADGVRRVAVFVTSAYASYSSCRQYRENLAAADPTGLRLDKLRLYFNHPGFVAAQADRVRDALAQLPDPDAALLLFTAHSIPVSAAERSGPVGGAYPVQVAEAARLVAAAVGKSRWEVAWQSRSGPPSVPWLEPDVLDRLRALPALGETTVLAVPIGFVSDHMEVRYDLDVEAADVAAALGLTWARARTVGVHPRFVQMVRELVEERESGAVERPALGRFGPSHDVCPVDCCFGPLPRPAAAGTPEDLLRPAVE